MDRAETRFNLVYCLLVNLMYALTVKGFLFQVDERCVLAQIARHCIVNELVRKSCVSTPT